jgi:hypothetical protein
LVRKPCRSPVTPVPPRPKEILSSESRSQSQQFPKVHRPNYGAGKKELLPQRQKTLLASERHGDHYRSGQKNARELASSHAELRDFYQPQNSEEERLVRELAYCDWLSRRARRCEKGAITLATSKISDKHPELSESEQEMLNLQPPSEARYELLQSSRGINHLLRAVEYAREKLLSRGDASSVPNWLLPAGVWKHTYGIEARVDVLEKEAASLNELKVRIEQEETEKRAAELDLAAIPEKDVLDRTQRSENSNRRHRYKVEAKLEQLQVQRKADAQAEFKKQDGTKP